MIQFAKEAIRLSAMGITVIPTNGKKPMVSGWNEMRGTTPAQIHQWESEGLWRNIAMVCGEASGNIVVIDFDGTGGYDLFKEKFPELVDTKTVATGSGQGYHVYFKCELLPDSLGVMGIIIPDTGEKINIEFRANNCLATLPPSIHPDTQQPYIFALPLPTKQISDLSAVIAWAKSLKPESIRESRPQKRDGNTLGQKINPKLLDAVERHFLAQPHKINKEWIVCSCPNPLAHKHGDENPSFSYNPNIAFGKCMGACGDMYLKDILPLIGIQARDFGGFYESQSDSEPQTQLDRMPTVAQAQPPIPPAPTPAPSKAIPVVTRSSRLTNYMNRLLDYDTPIEHPPVMFPLKVLHYMGGMAKVMKPGKLIGIVGVSGGGKTSLMETMVDGFLNYNTPSLVWSPEWTADEFIERSIQRYDGPKASDVYMHETYIWEKQNGIKDGAGIEMPKVEIESAKKAIKMLRMWEDDVGYLNMPFLTVGYLKSAIADTLASISFKPRVLVIDYLQLLHALEPDHGVTMYSLIMQIKTVCQQHNLVGVIASQVTKADTKGLVKGKKTELLDATSARYVNDDAFNLFITINPEFDDLGQKHPWAILNVAKNSMGRPGKVRVGVNWAKLSFEESPHSNQNNLDGNDDTKEDE